jgi:hypothetical protein
MTMMGRRWCVTDRLQPGHQRLGSTIHRDTGSCVSAVTAVSAVPAVPAVPTVHAVVAVTRRAHVARSAVTALPRPP